MKTGISIAINRARCLATALLCLAFILPLALQFAQPSAAYAQEAEKIVRVGWFESPFNTMDQYGRRSGYAYEYEQKIAAYTGWTYEYVEGDWPELLQMVENGEIDLMADISYTDERAQNVSYSTLPMGTEEYFLFIAPNNKEITQESLATLNGKKVGVTKGSVQVADLRDWAQAQGIQPIIVESVGAEDDLVRKMNAGELDACVTIEAYEDRETALPICEIGSSDYYFVVNKGRPDILSDLNTALTKIQSENRHYNHELYEKYVKASGENLYLTSEEQGWLSDHGAIRVGYQDDYLAFCASDEATGELTGALKDCLASASDCLENAHLDFETIAFPTAAEALDALKGGEIDCMFPANLTAYDGETQGVVMTPTLMKSDMWAVVRTAEQRDFLRKEQVTVAVNEGNPNYDMFLVDNFPTWQAMHYADTPACLKAVAAGEADCILISSYRFNNIAKLCEDLNLSTVSTGVDMDYSFAVRRGDTELYSILTKATDMVPASTVNSALTYYSTEDAKVSLADLIMDNLLVVLAISVIVALVIITLLLRSIRATRRAAEEQQLIAATETDNLTGLYTRSFFFEYANRMHRKNPNTPMDAIVLDIEQFHSVNELKGREFGDRALTSLGNEIRALLEESPGIAGRVEADLFVIYCAHIDDYQATFDRLQNGLNERAQDANIRLRMGVMAWRADMEPLQMFDRARVACGMARGHYKEHLVVFDDDLQKREAYEQRLLNDVRRAVEEHEFEVYYQPKYDIQCEPPELRSAEALIRWNHPELGMIPPIDFIPLFERNGQIGIVDTFVWTEAVRQIASWRDRFGVILPVSVNLSRMDVFDPKLESTLDQLIESNGLERSALKLEVTESAYTEHADQVIGVITRLRNKGYEVEMDDFGTGYSSLSMISSMPIDVLKMDRAFIQNIEHDEQNAQLVELILDIAKKMNVPVVAEGVETESQMQLLKKLGCELVQGYYFSRPLPASEFEATILDRASTDD